MSARAHLKEIVAEQLERQFRDIDRTPGDLTGTEDKSNLLDLVLRMSGDFSELHGREVPIEVWYGGEHYRLHFVFEQAGDVLNIGVRCVDEYGQVRKPKGEAPLGR